MIQFQVRKRGNERVKRKRGFTLSQVLVVLGLMGVMGGFSTVLAGAYGRSRAASRHHDCDVHLMGVIAAVDTFRQDNRRMPYSLAELVKRRYTTPEMLQCPSDPHLAQKSSDPKYTSYGNGYIMRDVLDSDQLPMVVCPYHEDDGGTGEQAYKTFYTKRSRVVAATLAAGDWSGVVTVTRGRRVLSLPLSGQAPLILQSGDHFSIGAGDATIHFADNSTANMVANTELTVLQSFIQNQQNGTLYSIVHQALGTVHYYVNPGSNFDVSTPTATAGALGTRFTVIVRPVRPTRAYDFDTTTELLVTEHKVALTAVGKTVLVKEGEPAITGNNPDFPAGTPAFQSKSRSPRPAPQEGLSLNTPVKIKPPPTPVATVSPTTAPTTAPTAAPTTAPTSAPTTAPTAVPTTAPTTAPTSVPTAAPTTAPTRAATPLPTTRPGHDHDDDDDDDDDDKGNGKGNSGGGKGNGGPKPPLITIVIQL
jgi:type II secretory pathway pseudopilin PulG